VTRMAVRHAKDARLIWITLPSCVSSDPPAWPTLAVSPRPPGSLFFGAREDDNGGASYEADGAPMN
jgi:hypothetical protein